IIPSKKLVFTSFFGSFQCARFDLALNWNATESGQRIALAVTKLPASVPVTDKNYSGAIILNTGRPGESGISEMLTAGAGPQTIASSHNGDDKPFDIISFDLRGITNTTPRLKCFPDAFAQQAWLL
ncbi:hypothetical protein BJ878DRAFT_413163, partial [Calycina marina]